MNRDTIYVSNVMRRLSPFSVYLLATTMFTFVFMILLTMMSIFLENRYVSVKDLEIKNKVIKEIPKEFKTNIKIDKNY